MCLGSMPADFPVHYICAACLQLCTSAQPTELHQIKGAWLWLWTPLKLNPDTLSLVQTPNWQISSIQSNNESPDQKW